MTTLTTMHPLWGEFERRLERALVMGENAETVVAEAEAAAGEDGKRPLTEEDRARAEMIVLTHGCNGDADPIRAHEGTRAILAMMADVDVAGTLAFLRLHGGYCDCEILLNVVAHDCAGPPNGCEHCRHWKNAPLRLIGHFSQIERDYIDALK